MIRAIHFLTIAAAIILAAMALGSCFSERKAQKQVDHIWRAWPGVLAEKANLELPLILTGSDTARKIDSIPFFIQCPEAGSEEGLMEITAEDYADLVKAGRVIQAAPKSQPATTGQQPAGTTAKKGFLIKAPVQNTTITNAKEDTRKGEIQQAEATALRTENDKLRTRVTIGFSLAGSFLLILLVLLYFYFKLLKKPTV